MSALKVVGSFVGGIVVGGLVGYFVTRKSAEIAYAEIAAEEIQKVHLYYQKTQDEQLIEQYGDPESPVNEMDYDTYVEKLSDLGYYGDPGDIRKMFDRQIPIHPDLLKMIADGETPEEGSEDSEELEVVNIFDKIKAPDDVNQVEYEEAVSVRDANEPYIIHISEYMDQDEKPNQKKVTLRYYEDDATLVDEKDEPIPDVERLIGASTVSQFGKFSGDVNIVYVRNERPDVEMDFEILRETGSYTEAIMGGSL